LLLLLTFILFCGSLFFFNTGIDRSCHDSLKYLVPAARHGSWGNIVRKGFNRYLAGDMQGALVRYLEGGEMGYEVAHSNVGWMLDQTKMTEKEVIELFPRIGAVGDGAEGNGVAGAGQELASSVSVAVHDNGEVVMDSTTQMEVLSSSPAPSAAPPTPVVDISGSKRLAFHFYTLAKTMGASHNDLRLGDYHYHGYGGVPINAKEAVRYYRLASSAGVAEAAFTLAVLYSNGELTAAGTVATEEEQRAKLYPGPAEDVLATKYFDRCMELDPSTEVQLTVELALGRIWARKELQAWDTWWRHLSEGNWEEGVPLLTTSIENWLVSIGVVLLVVVLMFIYAGRTGPTTSIVVVAAPTLPEAVEEAVEDVVVEEVEDLPLVGAGGGGETGGGDDEEENDREQTNSSQEDDDKIKQSILQHLQHLRHQQATLRRQQAAVAKGSTSRTVVSFGRPYYDTKQEREEGYETIKQKFKAEALRKYTLAQQNKALQLPEPQVPGGKSTDVV
jgi:TPR repeat protein